MLKGSIAHLGAATACELALKLELMGKDGNLAESEAVTTALEAEFERVITTVTGFVSVSTTKIMLPWCSNKNIEPCFHYSRHRSRHLAASCYSRPREARLLIAINIAASMVRPA